MSDFFGRTVEHGDSMSADTTTLAFADVGDLEAELMLQRVNVAYRQPITRLYALESNKVYFVGGRPDGTMEATHVIGPTGLQKAFYQAYGNVCNFAGNFKLKVQSGCSDTVVQDSVTLKTPVISEIRLSLSTDNFIIFSGFTATFIGME